MTDRQKNIIGKLMAENIEFKFSLHKAILIPSYPIINNWIIGDNYFSYSKGVANWTTIFFDDITDERIIEKIKELKE